MTDEGSLLNDPDAMFAALWVVVGVMVLFTARRSFGMLLEGGLPGVIIVTQLFLTGIAIVLVATTGRVDLRKWSRPMALWVAYCLLALGIFVFMLMSPRHFFSDVSLFESWATHLLVSGQNPMTANMLVAEEAWNVSEQSANITATINGGVVSHYSYPGGTLWFNAIEQALLPMHRLGLVQVLACTGMLAWMIFRVDEALVPLALLAFFAPVLRPVSAAWGMITPLWLFPLGVGLAAWYDDRLDLAAVALGVAVASKQLAWPIAGLVLIHVLRTRGRNSAGRLAGISGATAAVLVGPFIFWDPTAWAFSALSVFLPFGPELVAQGVGLTSLTVGDVYQVPRLLHTVLTVVVASTLVGATWRYPEPMQWVIPFASILVMIVHYRTLPSYYAATVPLAVIALDARLQPDRPTPRPLLKRVVA